MNKIEFEKAFSDFLDNDECEQINEAVFQLVRAAFTAGWKAALDPDVGKITKEVIS